MFAIFVVIVEMILSHRSRLFKGALLNVLRGQNRLVLGGQLTLDFPFDAVTTLILSRLASFIPFFEVIPEIS